MIYIALLKGINVSGQKRILMADLRLLLSDSGLSNVKTYIQSGNVIFESDETSKEKLDAHIFDAIKRHYGFEVNVIVKKHTEIKEILNNCPFNNIKKPKSYFILLQTSPEMTLINEASKKEYPNEEYFIINDCIYFYCEAGAGKAKFDAKFFERKLNTIATSRNYNTMMKLLSLSAEKQQ